MVESTESIKFRDQKQVWHAMKGSNKDDNRLIIESANGAWVTDIDGNQYLDGMSGLWCVNVGYGRQELAQTAYNQLNQMSYFPLAHGHKPAIELAEKLNSYLNNDYVFFFSNSGSEANETAFKIARQYHEQKGEGYRTKFISRYRSYHGNTMGALAATGQAERKYKYEPLAQGFLHVPPPDMYRNPNDEQTLESVKAIDEMMTWELSNTIAGVIMEPIITGGGILMPPQTYLKNVQETCKKHGALLIVDEVICGFGRTGKAFGFMNYDVQPDIITMAKGITSGYLPLSVTAVKKEIFETFAGEDGYSRLRHVNTYGGNPAACAVALNNIEIMEREHLFDQSKYFGERLLNSLETLLKSPNVGDVRGKGLLVGIELVEDKHSQMPLPSYKTNRIVEKCREKGLLIGKNTDTVAGYDNVLQIAPPLSITEDDLDFIIKIVIEVISEM